MMVSTNDNTTLKADADREVRVRKRHHQASTPEDFQHGRSFATWLKAGLAKNNWNDKDLSEKTKEMAGHRISPTWIGILRKDGISPQTGDVQHPSEEYIHILAVTLGMDEDDGREAAGYKRLTTRPQDQIVLNSGQTYTFVANPTGENLQIEITPELLRQLELHSELQKLRRERS